MRGRVGTAAFLGLLHALVDAATVGTVFAEVGLRRFPIDDLVRLVAVYNILAFGLQLPLGWIADRLRAYKPFALAGLVLALAGLGMGTLQPGAAAALAGVGNALFHVGAGAIVLGQWPGRASGPGIFVAPGALGLAAGVQQGLAAFPFRPGIALALAVAAGAFALVRTPVPRPIETSSRPVPWTVAAALLLFLSVSIRSFVGDALAGPWRGTAAMAWMLAAAAAAGKALGGVAADRWGWKTVPVAALLLMTPLAGAAAGAAPVAILGLFLVQTTMAVTLSATSSAFPGRPGVAFGLPSLALILGVLLDFTGIWPRPSPGESVPILTLAAAGMIVLGLRAVEGPRREGAVTPRGAAPPARGAALPAASAAPTGPP